MLFCVHIQAVSIKKSTFYIPVSVLTIISSSLVHEAMALIFVATSHSFSHLALHCAVTRMVVPDPTTRWYRKKGIAINTVCADVTSLRGNEQYNITQRMPYDKSGHAVRFSASRKMTQLNGQSVQLAEKNPVFEVFQVFVMEFFTVKGCVKEFLRMVIL